MADSNVVAFNNYRHLPDSSGISQHFFEFCIISLDIIIICPVPESQNGLLGKGSASLAEDKNSFRH